MNTSIDHLIIAVPDLNQASRDFSLLLGRSASWRGSHPDYGTANTLFKLDNTYIELLAASGEGMAADIVNNMLSKRGSCLGGLVFGTEDAEAFITHARQKGLASHLPEGDSLADGAISGVDHVVVNTQSAEAAKAFYNEQLGIRLALEQDVPQWGGTQLFFRASSMSIEVIASGKATDKPGTRVCTAKSHTLGVPTLLIEHQPV